MAHESGASKADEREVGGVCEQILKMDDMLDDSAVEFVEAEMLDENDSEAGLVMGVEKMVDAREFKSSAVGSITYFLTICCGRGCKGGKGGIGKLITGPKVTCLKYVVK